jgi:PTS system mannose-specific IIB component/fructoselysine and glucoselysine-specific PTS system IIB component
MSLSLVRLDDRLIHGQVVVGWVQALAATHIMVVDDRVWANEWEQEIYRLGVPAGLGVSFESVESAADKVAEWLKVPERVIVLIGGVATCARLCDRCDAIKKLNLGGVHDGVDRRQRLPYVYLSDEEAEQLRELSDTGVTITAQAVPTESPIPLEQVLG